jgi:hypothetical protein
MRHLSPEDLLDLAEGAAPSVPDASSAHLSSCVTCRQQHAELRAIINAVTVVDVPEPSPLFWEHLSARVRGAIAAETGLRGIIGPGVWGTRTWRFLAPISAAAVALLIVILVVSLTSRSWVPAVLSPAAKLASRGASSEPSSDVAALVDDPTFNVVSDLTSEIDVETAVAAGLAPQGSADDAVNHLTISELGELERLLKEEMARTQAS